MALKVKHDFSETRAHTAMPLPLFHSPIHLNSWHMCTGAIGCVGTVPARGAWGVFMQIVLLYLRNGLADWCQILQLDEYHEDVTDAHQARVATARAHVCTPFLYFVNYWPEWAEVRCMASYYTAANDALVWLEMSLSLVCKLCFLYIPKPTYWPDAGEICRLCDSRQ